MSSWFIRRANVVNSAGGRLPAEYTELAYIQSTGTQYLKLGVSGAANILAKAVITSVDGNGQALLVCADNAAGGTFFGLAGSSTYWGFGAGTTNGRSSSLYSTVIEADLTFSTTGATGTVNGESIARSASVSLGNWAALATYSGNFKAKAKLYYCKVYQNGSLVLDLVPAKRNADSVVGMYDLVSDAFLTNAGTGTFSYGEL